MFKNFDVKKFTLVVLMVAIGAFFIGGLILLSTGGIKNASGKSETVNEVKSVSMDNVDNISVDTSCMDIIVQIEDRTDLKAELKGNISKSIKDRCKFTAEKNGNSINISYKEKSWGSFFSFNFNVINNLKLYVYVPKNYANKLDLDCSSGDIKVNDFNCKELKAETSSGDITINNINADKLTLDCTSGDITGKNITTKDSNVSTSSGDIKLNEYKGNVAIDATSGSVSIDFGQVPNKIDGETSSGDIKLTLPADSKFNVDAEVSSGDINCEFPITMNKNDSDRQTLRGTVGSDENKIKLNATSGDININKK